MSNTLTSTMTRRKQIGPRVPEDVWDMFKDYAEEKHGKQGMASEELAEAMINHVKGERREGDERSPGELPDRLESMDTKLDYILRSTNHIESFVDEAQEAEGRQQRR